MCSPVSKALGLVFRNPTLSPKSISKTLLRLQELFYYVDTIRNSLIIIKKFLIAETSNNSLMLYFFSNI